MKRHPKDEAPNLFAWGRDGIPGEFKAFIAGMSGDSQGSWKYHRAGVVNVANELRERLQKQRQPFIAKIKDAAKQPFPKLAHYERSMIYMLHTYCASHKEATPPELLWLTFEAFELNENDPAPELSQILGVPHDIRNMDQYFEASRLDGEADANPDDSTLSEAALARLVGVARSTIRRWRQMKSYIDRRKQSAMAITYWRDRDGSAKS
ncbi:hypothetical protein CK489_28840 [Bradyrhizobium sp. UFLA03-84]|uniref:hypothetical protein n=1 Tax=Bradyrhizobium sp. UFLA03-84 TaxID=418599 RepID=UPI000BAE2E96|nr:hypothetical protein [Bradyrhizobium sp. UFLA03-84]PAY05400.1 hypothetical protein CK489_28840 [Bradyrhizobium sp. UFLA03-84]